MGDEKDIDLGAVRAGLQKPLGDSRSHIHEEGLAAGTDQIAGAVAVGIGERAAGAEQGYIHGPPPAPANPPTVRSFMEWPII